MDDKKTVDSENEPITVSRRRLLQALAATGLVVGMDRLLPGSWATPTAEAAPDLFNPTIGDMQIYFLPVNGGAYYNGSVRFRYSDPVGNILSNAPITAVGTLQGPIADDQSVGSIGGKFIPYNATYGTMRFPLPNPSFSNSAAEEVKLGITDSYNPSRHSNVLTAGLNVGNYGVLNISSLLVLSNPLLNASAHSAAAVDCELTAVFDYNGSVAGMVRPSTSVYAWLNSAGWVSPGGSIANMGGDITYIDNFSGRVRLPLAHVANGYFGGEPDDLCLLLEGESSSFRYATPEVMKTFVACGRPAILSLSSALCSPSAADGQIGCQYNVAIGYYDASAKMSNDSRVTVRYDGQTLIDDKSFSELGVSIPNRVQGDVTVPVLIPTTGVTNGLAHELAVRVKNDDGVQSGEASTLVTDFCDPLPQFPLGIETTAVLMDGNATVQDSWKVDFDWHDPAGVFDDLAQITAVANSSGVLTTIFNGMPIGNVGGVTPTASHPFFPGGGINCTVAPVNATLGNGHFAFNFSTPPALAGAAEQEALPMLTWFLLQPVYRESDTETVVLDPEAGPPPDDAYRAFVPIARSD